MTRLVFGTINTWTEQKNRRKGGATASMKKIKTATPTRFDDSQLSLLNFSSLEHLLLSLPRGKEREHVMSLILSYPEPEGQTARNSLLARAAIRRGVQLFEHETASLMPRTSLDALNVLVSAEGEFPPYTVLRNGEKSVSWEFTDILSRVFGYVSPVDAARRKDAPPLEEKRREQRVDPCDPKLFPALWSAFVLYREFIPRRARVRFIDSALSGGIFSKNALFGGHDDICKHPRPEATEKERLRDLIFKASSLDIRHEKDATTAIRLANSNKSAFRMETASAVLWSLSRRDDASPAGRKSDVQSAGLALELLLGADVEISYFDVRAKLLRILSPRGREEMSAHFDILRNAHEFAAFLDVWRDLGIAGEAAFPVENQHSGGRLVKFAEKLLEHDESKLDAVADFLSGSGRELLVVPDETAYEYIKGKLLSTEETCKKILGTIETMLSSSDVPAQDRARLFKNWRKSFADEMIFCAENSPLFGNGDEHLLATEVALSRPSLFARSASWKNEAKGLDAQYFFSRLQREIRIDRATVEKGNELSFPDPDSATGAAVLLNTKCVPCVSDEQCEFFTRLFEKSASSSTYSQMLELVLRRLVGSVCEIPDMDEHDPLRDEIRFAARTWGPLFAERTDEELREEFVRACALLPEFSGEDPDDDAPPPL